MNMSVYLYALIPMLIAGLLTWIISVIKKDVSIVDSLWPVFFIILALYAYSITDIESIKSKLVVVLVAIWALRLSLYITMRHWGHEEDHRYQAIRKNSDPGFKYKSLYMIFSFQAIVAWIVSLPLFYAINTSVRELTTIDYIGLTLWCTGMLFESVADYQLWKFKQLESNKGKVLTEGLWAYSRHPNYFGEFLVWWGFFCFALSTANFIAIVSPLLMTYLLLKFSGVSLLEKTMILKPGYETYMKNTNAFLPGFKNRSSSHEST